MMADAGEGHVQPPLVPASMLPGLALLLQAYRYSEDVNEDAWQFAVEFVALGRLGMTRPDLRWLTCKGYAQHGYEVSSHDSTSREFRSIGSANFRRRSCFGLTTPGAEFAEALLQRSRSCTSSDQLPAGELPQLAACNHSGAASAPAEEADQMLSNGTAPLWNGERHQLRVGPRIVKEFKVPSTNQEAILTAFQEEGWPERIDDPLPPVAHIDPKRRLHDAIKGLNRNQKQTLIRFRGDGTGEGVRWTLDAAGEEE